MLHATRKVIAVLDDLFFTVKILDAAKRAGLEISFVKDEATVLERAKDLPTLIIFDLNCTTLNPIKLIQKIKHAPETKKVSVIAFLSHVQVDLKNRAQEAGADMVMPRSSFSQNLTVILQRHADQLAPESEPEA
jgi:CheY-like chemotaxis protein